MSTPRKAAPMRITKRAQPVQTVTHNNSQGLLPLGIEKDTELQGIGMGVLSDGTPYLNQRGLAALCDVENAHIGTISSQWDDLEKPRIKAIRGILEKVGYSGPQPHIEVKHLGTVHYCYPAEVSLAILEYYAIDAGINCKTKARDNYRILAGTALREFIYSTVGYDPTGRNSDKFAHWHDRIALNHQSAPKGFFHVFNEAHTIIYELIMAGADIGPEFVVDISIGLHWSRHWEDNRFEDKHGIRQRYKHNYPDTHPQAKSNPQESWCYPTSALGDFREWLQDDYLEGGKFRNYLSGKVKRGELPVSIAQLAISTLTPLQLPPS